jgi:hypothetical protein
LSKWVNLGSFDSEAQCDSARGERENGFKGDIDAAEGYAPDSNDVAMLQTAYEAVTESECIASDDRRLKEK